MSTTPKKRNPPTQEEYEAADMRLKLSYAPETIACADCNWPVLKGYCCHYCGSQNPNRDT